MAFTLRCPSLVGSHDLRGLEYIDDLYMNMPLRQIGLSTLKDLILSHTDSERGQSTLRIDGFRLHRSSISSQFNIFDPMIITDYLFSSIPVQTHLFVKKSKYICKHLAGCLVNFLFLQGDQKILSRFYNGGL